MPNTKKLPVHIFDDLADISVRLDLLKIVLKEPTSDAHLEWSMSPQKEQISLSLRSALVC